MNRVIRLGAVALGALLLAGTGAPAPASAEPAAAIPAISVSPGTDDLDPAEAGQKVLIKGSGFDGKFNEGKGYGVRIGPKRAGWRDKATTTFTQYSKLLKENWQFGIDLKPDGTWQIEPTIRANYTAGGQPISAATEQLYILIFAWDNADTSKDIVVPLNFKGLNDVAEVTLKSASVTQGGKLTFTGKGYLAGEPVSAAVGTAGLASVTANTQGGVSGDVVVPADIPVGDHTLVLTGQTSKRAASVSFTVTATACVGTEVTKGNLLWGFKKSFRQYVGNGAGNSIVASGGAVVTDIDATANQNGVTTGAHQYPFVSAKYDSASKFEVSFGGEIKFVYPAHLFTVRLGNPRVVVDGKAGSLFADVELTARDGAPGKPTKLTGVELAKLSLDAAKSTETGGVLTIREIDSTLASSEAFAGFYSAGDQLDDLTVTLGSKCSTLPTPPANTNPPPILSEEDLVPPLNFRPPAKLASTGTGLEGVYLGILLLLSGAGLIYFGRRGQRG